MVPINVLFEWYSPQDSPLHSKWLCHSTPTRFSFSLFIIASDQQILFIKFATYKHRDITIAPHNLYQPHTLKSVIKHTSNIPNHLQFYITSKSNRNTLLVYICMRIDQQHIQSVRAPDYIYILLLRI